NNSSATTRSVRGTHFSRASGVIFVLNESFTPCKFLHCTRKCLAFITKIEFPEVPLSQCFLSQCFQSSVVIRLLSHFANQFGVHHFTLGIDYHHRTRC